MHYWLRQRLSNSWVALCFGISPRLPRRRGSMSLTFSGTLASQHYSTLRCRLLLLHLVCISEKAIHQLGNDGRCSNGRQRAVVQDLIHMWHPYVLFEEIFSALTTRASTPAQIIANLKKVIISGMVREAKSRLAIKIDREGWKGGIDHIWVDLVASAPKRQCRGIDRHTLLRWAVNQDDDVWLSMRGTRHQQKCVHCGFPNCLPLWLSVSPYVRELHSGQTTELNYAPLYHGVALYFRHKPATNRLPGRGLATVLGHHENI